MGTHCSSAHYRGHRFTMKLLLLTALAAVAVAEPGYYLHQLNWPGYRAPGFSRQCFGCRALGKRSADADADALYYGYYGLPYAGYYGYGLAGVAGHPTGTSYTQRSPQGLRGKRSAEEAAAPAYGIHPGGGKSFVGQTVRGFPAKAKRSAEPWGLYRPYGLYPYGRGIAGHAGGGVSFTHRSPQGLGK